MIITCIAEGWAVQGCGNRNGHRNHDSYFGPEDVRERMLLHVKGRGANGGVRTAKTVPDKTKWQHDDAADAYNTKTDADMFKFKAAANLRPRVGLPMWDSRAARAFGRN